MSKQSLVTMCTTEAIEYNQIIFPAWVTNSHARGSSPGGYRRWQYGTMNGF